MPARQHGRPVWLATTLPLALALSFRPARAADPVVIEVFGGSALQLRTRTTFRQEGEPDLRFTARWETHPFLPAPYYAWRVGLWHGRGAWELQWLHHKAYLENPPPEIQSFEVSHGYNILTFGRAMRLTGGLELHAGAGPVITHTEGVVRGRTIESTGTTFADGYDLAGAAIMVGAGWKLPLVGGLFATVNAEATGAWARVKIAGGTADVPNVALHGLVGLGYTF
ncbi:MAG TPA: hypothetical protein VLJ18_00575 [Thermoanaerobaculia bacterium]|nr:hypothetical protein [Thermoanaerobaculia bacterium]